MSQEQDNFLLYLVGGIFALMIPLIIGAKIYDTVYPPEGAVSQSSDDFTIKYVGRERLKSSLKDPGSLEIISEEVVDLPNGGHGYRATFRAKNSFGGYVTQEFYTE